MFLLIFILLLLLSIDFTRSSSIKSSYIRWKYNWDIHYLHKVEDNKPSLLLVPGFGVGTFHYERNIEELSKYYSVYTLDLFGQGKSWPPSPDGITKDQQLVYSR